MLGQNGFDIIGDLWDHIARFFLQGQKAAHDRIARFGIDHAKGEVFQLLAHPLHPHTACKRRVDIHCLARFLQLLFGAHMADGAHIVQSVGQFHEDHAQILGHGHEQFAKVLSLL